LYENSTEGVRSKKKLVLASQKPEIHKNRGRIKDEEGGDNKEGKKLLGKERAKEPRDQQFINPREETNRP